MAIRPEQTGIAHHESVIETLSSTEKFELEQIERDIDDQIARIPPATRTVFLPLPETTQNVRAALVEIYRGAGWRAELAVKLSGSGKGAGLQLTKR